MKQDNLRKLPKIDQLLISPNARELVERYGRDEVTDSAREAVDALRERILRGESPDLSAEGVLCETQARLEERYRPSIRYTVNATGVVLHTGLGRAMLPPDAVEQIQDVIKGYCTLAVNLETGRRESRDIHYADLLCELTGAEAATVVNNNAAATMIILNTLARGKEVIISRGQLVEIGGSFRMPDVMETSGARMREVGTTNKTHLRDYANAVNENTGAIMHVHTSNYRIMGFAESPDIRELAQLAHEHGLPLIDDLGSGALVDLGNYGLEKEPLVQESIEAGADVACFSGDKLIGGPQCGIIVGKARVIADIKKNPLARALRVGKMTTAALEATLRLFRNMELLNSVHPTYRMLSLTPEEMEPRAQAAAVALREALGDKAEALVVDGESQVGSGSVPTQTMPTRCLSVCPKEISTDTLAKRLRYHVPPVFGRVQKDALLFDFRTIQPWEDELVVRAVGDAL